MDFDKECVFELFRMGLSLTASVITTEKVLRELWSFEFFEGTAADSLCSCYMRCRYQRRWLSTATKWTNQMPLHSIWSCTLYYSAIHRCASGSKNDATVASPTKSRGLVDPQVLSQLIVRCTNVLYGFTQICRPRTHPSAIQSHLWHTHSVPCISLQEIPATNAHLPRTHPTQTHTHASTCTA